jgi:hypothetical protein
MTDIWFLVASILAIVIAVDPANWLLEKKFLTKHLHLIIFIPVFSLTVIGGRLFRGSGQSESRIVLTWPLTVLALLIILGSMVARIAEDTQNTFVFAGVYMLAAPATAYIVLRSGAPDKILSIMSLAIVSAGFAITLLLATGLHGAYGFHELEFLVAPCAIYVLYSMQRSAWRSAAFVLFVAGGILFRKNTGNISVALLFLYVFAFVLWPKLKQGSSWIRTYKILGYLVAFIFLIVAITFLARAFRDSLPTGSPEFRLLTYARAYERFLESPIYGSAFMKPSVEVFSGFNTGVANNILPTHSDLLDLLSNGGLVAIFLWAWGHWRIGREALILLAWKERSDIYARHAHLYALATIVAIITYAFNPLFLQPAKSYVVWMIVGLLAACIELRRRRDA